MIKADQAGPRCSGQPYSPLQRGAWKKVPYLWNHTSIHGFLQDAIGGT
jgi:hypothetical protein